VFCAGAGTHEPASLVASTQMRRLIDDLRAETPDAIAVFDAPPLIPTPDPLSLAAATDATVLVVNARETPRDLVQQAVRTVPAEKLLGIVLNGVALGNEERLYYGYYRGAPAASEVGEPRA
jgi:Mrp family chromosome partitioning ATPase